MHIKYISLFILYTVNINDFIQYISVTEKLGVKNDQCNPNQFFNYSCFAKRPYSHFYDKNITLGFFLSIWQLRLWYFYLHALWHLATDYTDELVQCSETLDAGCIGLI